MNTKPWGYTSYLTSYWDNSGLYAEPLFYQDLEQVMRKYMDHGFIQVQVGDPEVNHDESGIEVSVRINRATPITPISLVTLAMLGRGDRALSVEEMIAALRTGRISPSFRPAPFWQRGERPLPDAH